MSNPLRITSTYFDYVLTKKYVQQYVRECIVTSDIDLNSDLDLLNSHDLQGHKEDQNES